MARFVGTAIPAVSPIGTIEPHLEDVAISSEQFTQLVAKIGDVFRPSVFRMVSVPRREIDGELKPFLATGFGQFTHHVTLSILPR